MGILDNFEAWADLDKPHTPPNPLWLEDPKWPTKIFHEEVCDNCGCKNESNSENLLSPKNPR